MADRPIHLPPAADRHTEASIVCPVWLTQSSLDALYTHITFLEGMDAAGKGRMDGHFELVMFYRTLRGAVHDHLKKLAEPTESSDEFVEVSEHA